MARIKIVEVGPRDGLQNEKRPIPAEHKIELIDRLSAVGFAEIESASFVSPKWVPQMADGPAVMTGISRRTGTVYSALTPNMKGYEAARAAKVDQVAIFAAASESFSRKNINASIEESLERFRPVAEAALRDGIALRGYVSCVVHCPYEGSVAPEAAARVALALLGMGAVEISLGDTTGQGTPETVSAMLDAVLDQISPGRLAGHYHDTNGRALDNVAVSIARGITTFDSAVGGLGGCPYAPGAKGNLATGKLARWCAEHGHETGLNLTRLAEAEAYVDSLKEAIDGLAEH